MRWLHLFLAILFVTGCSQRDTLDDVANGIFVVESQADLVEMSEGHWEDSGEFVAFDTYRLPCRVGKRSINFLFQNGVPSSLERGDRFRLVVSLHDCYFDQEHDGYHISFGDIQIESD